LGAFDLVGAIAKNTKGRILMSKLVRRDLLRGAAGLGLASIAGVRRAAAEAAGPIRIGLTTGLSGPVAVIGKDVRIGAELAVAQINKAGGVRGRPLELVVRDTKGDPPTCVAVTRELAGDGVKLFLGGTFTAEAMAAMPVIQESGGILMVTGGIGMNLTHENFDRRTFRVLDNDFETLHGFARLAADKYPDVTNWGACAIDAAASVASANMMQKLLTDAYGAIGKKITFVDPVLVKYGAGDYKNQIAALTSAPIDGLYVIVYGQDGITFYQQARGLGLPGKLKAILDRGNEFTFAKAMRKNVPANFWASCYWSIALYPDLPMSRALYDDYVALTGDRFPQGFLNSGSAPIYSFAQAIAAAEGDTNADTLIKVFESGLMIQTAKGPIRFRKEDHQVEAEVPYIKLGPSDDETGFKIYDTAKYKGGELLEQPMPGNAFNL
jgi:branched-chain amino acid transport system substrate-binding protein